jgi:hypothetical protein
LAYRQLLPEPSKGALEKFMRRTLGEQLRDAQKIKRLERIDLLLKIVCLTLIGGYILWIIKTIN